MSTGRYSFYTPSSVDAATVNKSKAKGRASSGRQQPQSSQQQQPTKQSEKLALLSQKLTTYARGCDRRQILRLLGSNQYTKMYTLKNAEVDDIAMAEREASGERGILNGVKFLQVRGSGVAPKSADSNQPMDSYFLQTLREICGHMCDMDGVFADPMALYGGLLLRLSRSTSERDALEIVTKWLAGRELVVLPLKRRHHLPEFDFEQNANVKLSQPVDVELYVESGNVHSKVTMSHEFGLYRKADLESHGLGTQLREWEGLFANEMNEITMEKLRVIQYSILDSPRFLGTLKPWIFVDAEVVERVNFGSGDSVRLLYVNIPERKNSGYAAIY